MTIIQTTFEIMKFIPPTLEQVKEQAKTINLPLREAEKFFLYYEANGWRTGRTKMQKWRMALSGWKLRWEERQPNKVAPERNGVTVLSNAQIVLFSEERRRILKRLEDMRSESDVYGWTPKLMAERRQRIAREKELRKILGITI